MMLANSLYWLVRDYYLEKGKKENRNDQTFVNAFGVLFEDYIKDLASKYCVPSEWRQLPAPSKKKGADFMFDFGSLQVIIESKSALLKLDAKQQVPNIQSINSFFDNTIKKSYKQLVSSYDDLRATTTIPIVKVIDNGMIDVNHTLIYYRHAVNGCYCNVHSPKTSNGVRTVPMLQFVKEAFQEEQQRQLAAGIHCQATVDGYTDFIFVNRFGQPQHQGTLNKALRRIIRDCNDEILLQGKKNPLLLPHFSCHSLRHTFTTRMCEAGVNIKVIQDALGHADVSTTLNIYADATRDLKKSEFASFESYWNR